MCGIAGLWSRHLGDPEELRRSAEAMAATLSHRGPDDCGSWAAADKGIAFGFQRLAIVDLSPHGHQPMSSSSGRYQVVFNGEIYNYVELRTELQRLGHAFRGNSDTEVALAAFERWGVERAIPKFIGMFAMGIWDSARSSLWLVRDRLGIKPLFIYAGDGLVAFGSELKAFAALTGFGSHIDPTALALYFRYLYVPAPYSILAGVSKLLPGHFLEIRDPSQPLPASRPYWSLGEAALRGIEKPFVGGDAEATDLLEATLLDAVRLRMRADVPVGAFLSGGIDSTAVVALMQTASRIPVRTFTIGFDTAEHDESSEAESIAGYLGTNHTTLRVTGPDALALIPELAEIFDEPLADPSQIPTYLVCRLAREDVTVALSGDGGDELFAGYNRYLSGERAIKAASSIPYGIRSRAGRVIGSIPPRVYDRLIGGEGLVLGGKGFRLAGEKAHKVGRLLRQPTATAMYQSLVSAWQVPPLEVDAATPCFGKHLTGKRVSLLNRMMFLDQLSYLPDDLLAKVDRASMATSLEVRVPLLDHRLVELSWCLPRRLLLRGAESKWLLRQVVYRYVPRKLLDRPKVGFTVPLAEWLRGPLRSWAEDLLHPSNLATVPSLKASVIRSTWEDFLAGRTTDHLPIWAVLNFLMWHERWAKSIAYANQPTIAA